MELHRYSKELDGIPWNSKDNPWNSTALHGPPWNYMAFHGTPSILHGIPWKSMDTPWNFMAFHGIPWNSINTPWSFMDTPWNPTEVSWKSMEVFHTGNSWFSLDVTKIQTKKLSLLLSFYFHVILEHLKTFIQTNFRFKRVLCFAIQDAWISRLLRDAAFSWRPGKLLCGLKTLPIVGDFAI